MPHKDPEARREYMARRYREQKHLWRNPDGTWKRTQDPQRRRDLRRARYQADAVVRAAHGADARGRRDARRRTGSCPICLETPPRYGTIAAGQMVRDHDHATGLERGWICSHCNLALGHAKDSPRILRAMADYLEGKTTVAKAVP